MTREEAIAKLKWYFDSNLIEDISGCEGVEEAIGMAIEALEAQKWIPVSKRLPEEDTNVLVSVHFKGLEIKHKSGWNDHIKESYYVEVAEFTGDTWESYSDEYKVAKDRHEVVAWQPLPEPFKEEET